MSRSWKRPVFAALAAAIFAAGAWAKEEAVNALTDAEKAEGWKLLFDGKSASSWRGFKSDKLPDGWTIEGGALARTGKGGDIVTVDEFESFELKIDWKIAEGGNSGIFFHVSEDEGTVWKTGIEMQVLDDAKHHDGQSPLTSAGSCYALYPPAKKVVRPVGEWNEARLVVKGPKVEHWLNGEKIVEYEIDSEDWKKRVAESKFKAMPKFATNKKGHLALQDHGDRVEFRNIKVRTLP